MIELQAWPAFLPDLAAQILGVIALALCVVAFGSKSDDRLLRVLIAANVAFALHFLLFGQWAAGALTGLIIVRILLARRFPGSWLATAALLAAGAAATAATWQGPLDLVPLTATVFGTIGMVMLRGIPMRLLLAAAGLTWTLNNLLIGSVGGTLAEALVVATNVVTIVRLSRARAAEAAGA